MPNPSPQTRLLTETEIEKIRGILEETSKDSFGIPATQGEIEHYEDNKERLLGMLPALLADREELVRQRDIAVNALEFLQESARAQKFRKVVAVSDQYLDVALSRIRSP